MGLEINDLDLFPNLPFPALEPSCFLVLDLIRLSISALFSFTFRHFGTVSSTLEATHTRAFGSALEAAATSFQPLRLARRRRSPLYVLRLQIAAAAASEATTSMAQWIVFWKNSPKYTLFFC